MSRLRGWAPARAADRRVTAGFFPIDFGAGDDAARDFDFDGDNEVNFYEYGFGGNPTNATVKGYVASGMAVDPGALDPGLWS